MNVPLKIEGKSGWSGAIADKMSGERRRVEFSCHALAGCRVHAPAAPCGAGAGLIKPQQNALGFVFFRSQQQAARCREAHGFFVRRNGAERNCARCGEGLFCCPERVDLGICPHQQKPVERHSELGQTFGIGQSILEEIPLGCRPKNHASSRSHKRPCQRKAECCRMIPRCGRHDFVQGCRRDGGPYPAKCLLCRCFLTGKIFNHPSRTPRCRFIGNEHPCRLEQNRNIGKFASARRITRLENQTVRCLRTSARSRSEASP